MKRRVRILPPGYLVGTKGHSVLKKKTYVRRPLIEVEEYSKMPTSRRHEYDSGYQLGSFHDARAFSNAVMDDSYDLQSQSRGRDHRLLSHMNDALVSTDLRRPPKAAVTILRATRRPVLASKPLPPRTTYYPKRKEVPATGPYYPYVSARYIPGRVKRLIARYPSYSSTLDFVDCDETDDLYPRYSTKFRLYDPAYIGRRAVARRPLYRHGYYLPWYSGWRAVARGRYMRSVPSLHHGRVYQLPQPLFKALLVGEDKLDDPDRPRPRKPRTRYYAEKLKKMDDDKEQLSSIMATTPKTRILKASKPPNPYPSYSWRAIREVDGYTRPKNPMYWQYRVESHLEPDDLIHKPSTYGTMRDQVRGVQDKLDRHRQLLDRYRETDLPAAYDPIVHRRHPVLGERIISHADRVVPDLGFVDSHAAGGNLSAGRTSEEGGAADGLGKVSPLRKKLRKVICKSRHNPSYYDE